MTKRLKRLELTWIGKEERPRLEPRILLEEQELSYAKRVSNEDLFDNRLIHGDNLLALAALLFVVAACAKPSPTNEDAKQLLLEKGYSSIEIVEDRPYSDTKCEGRRFYFPFDANGPDGFSRKGFVCCSERERCFVRDGLSLAGVKQRANQRIQQIYERQARDYLVGRITGTTRISPGKATVVGGLDEELWA